MDSKQVVAHPFMIPDFITDISVATAPVPLTIEGAIASGALWQATPDRFLINVPDVARYLVENGNSISIEPWATASLEAIERMLNMTPLAALLYQRGIMVFHAAAVVKGNTALLLAGDSGSGKSTLLVALLQRGWKALADDLAIVDIDADGGVVVQPFVQDTPLWADSLQNLGIASSELNWADSSRQILPLTGQIASCPYTLQTIYWLGVHRQEEIEVKEILGGEKFRALGLLSYNSHIADALLNRVAHMRSAAAVAKSVKIRKLYRPRGEWSVSAIADIVEGEFH